MHFVIVHGNNILNAQLMSPVLSWLVVIGSLAGLSRFVRDAVEAVRRH